jgi:hypothetical protein
MSSADKVRWMTFVDGENFLAGAQKSIGELKLEGNARPHFLHVLFTESQLDRP